VKKRASPKSTTPGFVSGALSALFFFSGIAGLGYQILWAKFFSAGIGHEFPAVLAVVTAFMAGMAAGSGAMHRLGPRFRSARLYGILELVIGLWGAVTVVAIPKVNLTVISLLGPNPSNLWHWLVVFSAVLATLLPATAAMGASLPAIERFTSVLARQSTIGLLYACNTGGAVFGALLTVFWWMPRFGIAETLLLLASLNLVCGITALFLTSSRGEIVRTAPISGAPSLRLKTALFATGLLGIAYEASAVRALSHVLENTVYTFAVVLGVHLLGNAAGAAVYHKSNSLRKSDGAALFAALAAGAVAGALLLWEAQPLYNQLRLGLSDSLYSVAVAEMCVAALVFLLPSIAMGATFSFLADRSLQIAPNIGLSVFINTCGAALAPALFGLWLIPAQGLKFAFCLIPIAYALLIPRLRPRLVVAGLAAIAGLIIPGTKALIQRAPETTFRSLKEGIMASVAVIEDQRGDRVLKVNNRFQMGGTAARSAEERHADIPLLLHPNPRRALFIGLGTGITFATARYYPGLVADGVELVPEVAESLPLFEPGPEVFENPNLRIHVADGRRFILTATNRYDVIVADLFHPAQDGAGFLYSEEHFKAIRQRLAPGGVFCQWLPLYQMNLETLRIIAKTFLAAFPEGEAWLLRLNVDTPVVGLIARLNPALFTSDWVERRLVDPTLEAHLKRDALADSVRLLGSFLGGPGELSAFAGDAPINTEMNPIILFQAPLFIFKKNDHPAGRLLKLVGEFPPERLEALRLAPELGSRTEKYILARNVYLQGLAAEGEGEMERAIAGYLDSTRLSNEFTSGYAQCLAIATALSKSNREAARMILEKLAEAQPDRPVARELLERLK
jgi:spermidine synthase